MKKPVFKPEQYSPSSEDHRQCIETQRNYHRNNAYLEKKGELDVTYPQDGLNIAQASEENLLLNDPAYQEFIDNVNKTPF